MMFCAQDSWLSKASYASFICFHFPHVYLVPCVFCSFSFIQGMFFLSFNLRFKAQWKFLVCFDGCDVIKIPLFNSNIGAAKKISRFFVSFYPVHDAVNCDTMVVSSGWLYWRNKCREHSGAYVDPPFQNCAWGEWRYSSTRLWISVVGEGAWSDSRPPPLYRHWRLGGGGGARMVRRCVRGAVNPLTPND
jgi:hypothetical protein